MTEGDDRSSFGRLIAGAAARGQIALRLEGDGLERLLRSVVEATVELFDAEAASIALVEPDGRLRFRVAAGARASGVVGLTVAPGEGIAGYVVATGQPIALSNVAEDTRFDRATATRTGYVPRSLLAVPLLAADVAVGVLEVLDRRGGVAFGLRDISTAGAFARLAAEAIAVTRVDRDVRAMVERALLAAGRAAEPAGDRTADAEAIAAEAEAIAADALRALDLERGASFWRLVDRLAALLADDPGQLTLVGDLIEAASRHTATVGRGMPRGRRSWRDLAALEDLTDLTGGEP